MRQKEQKIIDEAVDEATGGPKPKKLTLKDRKKAQPKAVLFFSEAEKQTLIQTVAKNLSEPQRNIFFYTCQALGLNPLLSEIACVTYKNHTTGDITMSIQVMRDGFLTIAHRSGKFAGLESGVKLDESGKIICGWAKVYHKDFTVPVYQEAEFEEYNTPTKGGKPTLWALKPKTMIKKVAESMALRKAFNVSGVYTPEEMDREIVLAAGKNGSSGTTGRQGLSPEDALKPASPAILNAIKTYLSTDDEKNALDEANITQGEAAVKLRELITKN